MNREKILLAIGKENIPRKDIQSVLRCKTSLEEALISKSWPVETFYLEPQDFNNSAVIKTRLLAHKPACVFNLFEGFSYDSGKEIDFVRILEDAAIPFTGNPSYPLEICLNKENTKQFLRRNNILTPNGIFIKNLQDINVTHLSFPLFTKPCFEDASLGIDKESLITNEEDLYRILEKKLKKFPKGVIVEEFIPGEEYSIGLLGSFPYEVLGLSVLDYAQHKDIHSFLTFQSKWAVKSEEFIKLMPSLEQKIDENLKQRIIDIAVQAGKTLKCTGYFRVDMRRKDTDVFVLDVNPNPDIDKDSGFVRQAYHKGYTYPEIIERILSIAISNHK